MAISKHRPGVLEWVRGAVVGGLLYARAVCKPSPSHRPRVARNGGVFYAKSYQEFHNACQEAFRKARNSGGWSEGTVEGPLCAAVDIACPRPRTTAFSAPRGDADNFAKAPLDAATLAGLWNDDSSVSVLIVQKRWTRPGEEAGAALYVGRLPADQEDFLGVGEVHDKT